MIYLVAYMLGPILSGILAGIFMRNFAIKHTPEPAHGSPFLGQRIRKTMNGSTMSPSNAGSSMMEREAMRQTSRFDRDNKT